MKTFNLAAVLLIVIFVLIGSIQAQNLTLSRATTTKKPARTCACEDTEEPICASNGVTYKNSCRFDCAKVRVTRLRMVTKGKCSTTTSVGQYWQNRNSKYD